MYCEIVKNVDAVNSYMLSLKSINSFNFSIIDKKILVIDSNNQNICFNLIANFALYIIYKNHAIYTK